MWRMDYWRLKWDVFHYNFGWSDWVWCLDGWIARCSMAVPVVGYLILFNDSVSQHLSFKELAGEDQLSVFSLTAPARLKLIYFGLIFLGTANILYRLRRPFVFRIGTNQFDYVERALEHFTVQNYIDADGAIKSEGHHTVGGGDYSRAEFQTFLDLATGNTVTPADWSTAKSRFEGLLRTILIETFSRNNVKRRLALTCCLLLALCGYFLLLIPSADLFVKVIRVTIRGVM